jgi:hypothetical protein
VTLGTRKYLLFIHSINIHMKMTMQLYICIHFLIIKFAPLFYFFILYNPNNQASIRCFFIINWFTKIFVYYFLFFINLSMETCITLYEFFYTTILKMNNKNILLNNYYSSMYVYEIYFCTLFKTS